MISEANQPPFVADFFVPKADGHTVSTESQQ